MMRSLFSGVAGLKNHQTRMDVIGNNITNVNTTGFKASRVNFQDILSQTMQGASSAQGNRGGTNPKQIGLGMGVASIDTIFTEGAPQTTGKQTDLYIQGQGFFIVSDGNTEYYTRAGNFDFDAQGNYLVPGSGLKVMGWMADAAGVINTSADISSIQIPVGTTMAAKPTTSYDFINNLSADAPVGKVVQANTTVYDSLGNGHEVNTTYIKTADNTWIYSVEVPDATTGSLKNTCGQITFKEDGSYEESNKIDNELVATAPKTGLAITTDEVKFTNIKLDSDSKSTHSVDSVVWDKNGKPHVITTTFTNTGTDTWDYKVVEANVSNASPLDSGTVTYDSTAADKYKFTPKAGGTAQITLEGTTIKITTSTGEAPASGNFAPNTTTDPDYNTITFLKAIQDLTFKPTGGAADMSIKFNFDSLTQYGGDSTIQATNGDGYPAGTLDMSKLTVDQNGIITATFTNGQSKSLGQVALAVFNNASGLSKTGDSLYSKSNNSGDPQIGIGGSGGRGTFIAGSLEMSNVDLAQQFSDMIITQRGFQANSKIITTSDEMLEMLANLKR